MATLMAVAGGKAPASTSPLAPGYYLANTKAELVSSLKSVTQDAAQRCLFVLNPAPSAPDLVAVKVAGAVVSRDPAKLAGWDYTSADFTTLEVFGAACDTIRNQAGNIEVIYGCPTK